MPVPLARTLAIAGAVITCPQCHARIGVLTKTLYENFTFGLDSIRFTAGQEPQFNQAQCRTCGASYAEFDMHVNGSVRKQQMLIHTDFGWLPRPPPDVPEPPRAPIIAPH